ncbi:hypothetical protein [Pseudomonas fluorescens]|nr:hypothetical protein [Pseudomonas fluorescens]
MARHAVSEKADLGLFDSISSVINGGGNGRAERRELWDKCKAVLCV